ncbi:cyclic nucleotide-binding domain-containing protein [Cystobacter fuscus]
MQGVDAARSGTYPHPALHRPALRALLPRARGGSGELLSQELELLPDREDPVAVPLFSMLGQDAFVALLEAVEVRTYITGHPVIREGDLGSSMFFMVEGRGDVMRLLEGRGPQEGPIVEGGCSGRWPSSPRAPGCPR